MLLPGEPICRQPDAEIVTANKETAVLVQTELTALRDSCTRFPERLPRRARGDVKERRQNTQDQPSKAPIFRICPFLRFSSVAFSPPSHQICPRPAWLRPALA